MRDRIDDLDIQRRIVRCFRAPTSVLVAALIAVTVVSAPADPAHACSCDDQPLVAYADEAIAAFVGRQIDRDVQDESAELTFDVEEVFLGEVPAAFRVRTAADGDACGVDLDGFGSVGVVAFGSLEAPTVGACPMTVPRGQLESVFGSGTAPPTDDVTTTSNTAARATLIGLLLVVLVAGAVLVHHRRRPEGV